MHPLNKVTSLSYYLLLFSFAQNSTQAFWLTDGSLFQQPSSKQVVVVDVGSGGEVVHAAALGTNPTSQQQQQVIQVDALASKAIADLDDGRATRPTGQIEIASATARNDTRNWDAATLAAVGGANLSNRIEPWVRVADIPRVKDNSHNTVQAAETKASSQEVKVVNQVCQCSSDWLQSQTNQWLSKWMNSADFANSLKQSIVSISNVPSSRQAANRASQTTNGISRSLAWNRTFKRNSNAPNTSGGGGGDGNESDAKSSQAHRTTNPDRHLSSSIHNNKVNSNSHNNNRDHEHSRQPVKLVQGQQGPKGERGPQGEQGPSALISVKDRDSLFDLGSVGGQQQQQQDAVRKDVEKSLDHNRLAQSQNNKQQRQPSGSRLVFIESEQMLVVETSIGWRPVPLLAPLKDFRKTIAKFSLNSAEDRHRLIMTGGEPAQQRGLQQLAGLGAGRKSSTIYLSDSPMVLFANTSENEHLNSMSNAIEGENGVKDAAKDDDADDEEEEEADDDDDDEAEQDGDDNEIDKASDGEAKQGRQRKNSAATTTSDDDDDDEDDDEDDDDDDDGDDDEEDGVNEIGVDDYNARDVGASDKRGANSKTRAKSVAKSESSKILANSGAGQLSDGAKTKRRRAQVSGRAAVSTTAGVVRAVAETNSVAPDFPAAKSPAGRATSNGDAERTVRISDPSSGSISSTSLPSMDDVMKLRLIALNEPFAGNQHGLRGANFECKRNAARANIKGAFRALLATNYQNLNEIIRYNSHVHKFPIVNLRGETLASSWHDLFKSPGRVANPLSRIYSFDGRHVASDPNWPNKLVWHGAGNKFGQRDSAHNCDGWHSDSLSKFGFASPLHPPRGGHLHAKHQSAPKKHTNEHRRRFADAEPSSSLPVANRDEERLPLGPMASGTQGNSTAVNRNRVSSSLMFEVIEKYPCRMPLIVLCIETIAQAD